MLRLINQSVLGCIEPISTFSGLEAYFQCRISSSIEEIFKQKDLQNKKFLGDIFLLRHAPVATPPHFNSHQYLRRPSRLRSCRRRQHG
jgi:hypothetical protein